MHTIISWDALDHPRYVKTYKWYLIAGGIMTTLVVYGILKDDLMLSLVFLIFSGVYFLVHREGSQIIHYKITSLGIHIEKKFIAYADITSFYTLYESSQLSVLHIQIQNHLQKNICIQLGDTNVGDVRDIMINRGIHELEGQRESLSSIISRILRI
jgi:hypothetical protein